MGITYRDEHWWEEDELLGVSMTVLRTHNWGLTVIQLSRFMLRAMLVDLWASLTDTHANSCPASASRHQHVLSGQNLQTVAYPAPSGLVD
jgi:hypothetical protein